MPAPLPNSLRRQRDATHVDRRRDISRWEKGDRFSTGKAAGVRRGLGLQGVSHMEHKASHQRQLLVDGHFHLGHVFSGARDDDALPSGSARELRGLLQVCNSARRRVDEAGYV